MHEERIQCFYVDGTKGNEALGRKIKTLEDEGFTILLCQSTDELACDHVEIEPGWIIITTLRPEIPLGTPKSDASLPKNKK